MVKIPKPKHDHQNLAFPQDFLWGAATSSYQVEGNNIYADWWEWEKRLPPHLRSGQACDEYNLYKQDFSLAKDIGMNAQRISVEWSRIEPKKGEFNFAEIEHYLNLLKYLKSLNFKVMLTLWHFTLPKWVADEGGWENPKTANYFENFVQEIVPQFKDYVDFWITINEPGVYVYLGYLTKVWPPQKKSNLSALKATLNLASTHKRVYQLLHTFDPKKPVGIAQNVQSFEPYHKHSFMEQLSVIWSDFLSNHFFYFLTGKTHDFLGINYYFHYRLRHVGARSFFQVLKPEAVNVADQARDVSDMGWEIYPEGIFDVLTDLSDDIPIYITECGIASTNDDRRARFLIQYLQEIYRAIKAGVKVKGFFYWSLIDNFEWHQGFDPRFGLVEVDYSTQKRTVRPSASLYREIISQNGIPHKLLKFVGHRVNVAEVL